MPGPGEVELSPCGCACGVGVGSRRGDWLGGSQGWAFSKELG